MLDLKAISERSGCHLWEIARRPTKQFCRPRGDGRQGLQAQSHPTLRRPRMSWTCCASRRCRSPPEHRGRSARIKTLTARIRPVNTNSGGASPTRCLTAGSFLRRRTGQDRESSMTWRSSHLAGSGRIVPPRCSQKPSMSASDGDILPALRSLTGVAPVTKEVGQELHSGAKTGLP